MTPNHKRFLVLIPTLLFVLTVAGWNTEATGGQLQLTWTDNSTDEDGFGIERKVGTTGTYAQIASVGADATSYVDSSLSDGTTYCYRVFAFNTNGNSPYSPESCGAVQATAQSFTLTVAKLGNGTVTTSPAGINCGTDCSEPYTNNTVVALTATAATGYTFAGWSGTGCASSVTMSTNRNCTALFNAQSPAVTQKFTLITNIVKTATTGGTGNGTVTSSPAGINCGSTCSSSYNSGTVVTLTATPATGSTFAGWSGTGCTTGTVTMNAGITCTATFNPQPVQTFGLSVTKSGGGAGTVTSSPAGINCGSTCSGSFNSGVVVSLTATAVAGSTFTGWSGTGCNNGSVNITSTMACTATFQATANQLTTRIGIFRPSTGEWFLDINGNGQWDQGVDIHITSLGHGDHPVVGSWDGTGRSNLGTFEATTGTWELDTNGDNVLDCGVDTCVSSFGEAGDLPVTRELSDSSGSIIGTFTPQITVMVRGRKVVKRGLWNFDINGNSKFDGCSVDECNSFGTVSELPVVGNWNGTGNEEIGLFLPDKGQWYLDLNGNGQWDGCSVDKCLGRFGTKGDRAVVGDWNNTGKVKIGVFRANTGMWYLDLNGNGKLDACGVDACFGPFGQPGDLPVVGKW